MKITTTVDYYYALERLLFIEKAGEQNVVEDEYEMLQKAVAEYLRWKGKARKVQCQMCAGIFLSADTERVKPYGSTRYERLCNPCAAKVKEAKAIYQGMAQTRIRMVKEK